MDGAKGRVWYGLHFYPGCAQYEEAPGEKYMVFLNEDTIRKMDPTFAGCPIFIRHVDEVAPNINEVKQEADGFVLESFYNESDGKHWCKFLTLNEKADELIGQGWCLSNCYIPTSFGAPGRWNGIDYDREITNGRYEHLAIVPDPRYEESKILSPDDFKKYNEDQQIELKRLANNKKEGVKSMLSFFKKAKVENTNDIENMLVVLPKSKKEILISDLVKNADEKESKAGDPMEAHPDHMVKMNDDSMMKVKDLVRKYQDCMNELGDMKKAKEEPKEEEKNDDGGDDDAVMDEDDHHKENEDKKEEEDKEEKKKNALEEKEAAKAAAKIKADRLKNAHKNVKNDDEDVPVLMLAREQVELGKLLF